MLPSPENKCSGAEIFFHHEPAGTDLFFKQAKISAVNIGWFSGSFQLPDHVIGHDHLLLGFVNPHQKVLETVSIFCHIRCFML